MVNAVRRSGVVLGLALAGLVVGLLVTLLARPAYTSRAEVYFKPGATLDATASARVASYAAMVGGDHVTAQALPGSLVVEVRASAGQAATARARVNDGLQRLQQRATTLEPTTRGLTSSVIAGPTTPVRGSSPWLLDALIGLVVGAAVGLLAVGLGGRSGPRRDERRVAEPPPAELARVPVSGQVSALLTPGAADAGRLRELGAALPLLDVDSDGAGVVLVSPLADTDATEVATQLAVALARDDESVVLVDADLRHRRVASLLGLGTGPGLAEVAAGEAEAHDVLQVHQASGLPVLVAGREVPDAPGLAASRRMRDVVADLRRRYELVLLTGSPLTDGDDALLLAPATDGLVLVGRDGRLTDADLRDVRVRATAYDAKVRGLVRTEPARATAPEPAPAPVAAPVAASVSEPEPEPVEEPADELVFPRPDPVEEPAAAETDTEAQIPAQRVETPELEPEAEPEPTTSSLLDDFLTDEEEAETEVEEEQAAPQPAGRSPFVDDLSDDAETMWRPRRWEGG